MTLSEYRLENLPRWLQLLLFALVAVAMSAVFYIFYLKGRLEERESLRAEIGQLEISVAKLTAVASQLDRFKQELAQLEERLNALRSILPGQKETPSVLRSVQQMAASSDLKIMKFTPRMVVPRDFYVDWPIGMEVQGNYDGLGLFFQKISQSTRIINVEGISIRAVDGSSDRMRTVNAVCTATTFVYREEESGAVAK
jgi:type IV pilus assembly protein PilO